MALVTGGLAATATPAKPVSKTYKDRYASIDFSWSAEAAAVPALARRFRADFEKQKLRTIHCGKLESEVRIKSGGQRIRCESSTEVTTRGETPRLLSLASKYWAFTGGAHGNGATSALLWDRRMNREIAFASLFASARSYEEALVARYCKALDQERRKRRGPDYRPGSVPEFDSCPKLSELALIPAASRARGKLNLIHLIAAPYEAGSFAEGEYDIVLPVTSQLVARLKPQYRSSFEAQRQ